MRLTSSFRGLALAAPALLLLLAGCAHPGPSGTVGGGGIVPPPPPPPPPPPAFTFDDLMGDWIGQLVPDNAARLTQNAYLRFDSDQLTESADSAGNEWTLTSSDRSFSFSTSGRLEAEMALLIGSSSLSLQAQMDGARAVLTGTYVQVGGDLFPVTGSVTLTRSSAGAFEVAELAGEWIGTAARPGGSGQDLEFLIDANGAVVQGRMLKRNGETRRRYNATAGAFSYFDDSIGRMENVVLISDVGQVSTFHYLLMDVDGTLLAGPGTDDALGAGLIRLSPAPPAN